MLSDAERFRLLCGPYRMPNCKIGDWLNCRLRGRARVVEISDGLIQWPIVVRASGRGRGLALCGDLVKAVKQESTIALQHWFGVKSNTVWIWRKALGVKQNNKGTLQLRSKWWTEGGTGEAARPGREATFHSPERAAKIAAAKRGKPRPPHVIEAMRRGRLGTPHTAETRAKISEAHKSSGSYPPAAGRPFTAEEDAILGTATDREIAEKIGRDPGTVAGRRARLGIASYRRQTRGW